MYSTSTLADCLCDSGLVSSVLLGTRDGIVIEFRGSGFIVEGGLIVEIWGSGFLLERGFIVYYERNCCST